MIQIKWLAYILLGIVVISIAVSKIPPTGIARLKHAYYGCFGGEKEELLIVKTGETIKAILTRRGQATAEVVLIPQQLERFRKLVDQIKMLKQGGGCTTTEY
jgi:hypothetical protein